MSIKPDEKRETHETNPCFGSRPGNAFRAGLRCAPTGESGGGQSSPAVSTDSNTSYTIATNNFGAGVYPLDTNAAYEQNAADALGVTLNVTNNEFTADKSITQLQNQLASAPDGVAFLGISETLSR